MIKLGLLDFMRAALFYEDAHKFGKEDICLANPNLAPRLTSKS